jgi:hypothetical protein
MKDGWWRIEGGETLREKSLKFGSLMDANHVILCAVGEDGTKRTESEVDASFSEKATS